MTSPQDGGRTGHARHGISRSGAMDLAALEAANVTVGNAPVTASLEFMLLGGLFEVADGSVRVAVAGAPCAVSVGGRDLPHLTVREVEAGDTIAIGPASSGVFSYLAVSGGFVVAPELGSVSFQPRAGIGGLDGRAVRAGDELEVGKAGAAAGEFILDIEARDERGPIRVVLGPQDDHFTPESVEAFLTNAYTVSDEADRMGYRLSGPPIAHLRGFNIVSDGLVAGSVQVPGSGVPIVMMADHQTTGGYPKIATVISADLGRLAQRRPGSEVRFAAVDVATAIAIARERAAWLAGLSSRLRPVNPATLNPGRLFALNLAGAAVDALAEPEQGASSNGA